MNGPAHAVFLSYAREDAEHARRIADALRAFGLEVWFDQNELRGGDAWDQKIRGQIRACALFIPVISARTQERTEGYFRREWKLAVDRLQDMAGGIAFIVPVVIDDTREDEALVPDEFMRVQWTRLARGVPTPEFVQQVTRLLTKEAGGRSKETGPSSRHGAGHAPARGDREQGTGNREHGAGAPTRGFPVAGWIAIGVVVVGVAAAVIVNRRGRTDPAADRARSSAVQAPSDFATAKSADKSIAVLPFANLSAERDNEFFADGVHDDLITAIAKVRDLKVISRTSVLPYRDSRARNLRKIAAELGVATVLEGSVQRAGNRVRINVQLIDAATDNHLWAETYNRELTDIFALQGELVREIAHVLKARLSGGETALLARRPTQNQRAYDLYLRARILDDNLGFLAPMSDYERVIALYEHAAAEDPAFALPHVQVSILHGTLYWFSYYDSTPERRALAEASLRRARALAPEAPETALAEGSFEYTCNNDWRAALRHYLAAESALPNDAQLQYRIAIACRRLGELPEALRRLDRALDLNPNDRGAAETKFACLLALRRYREVLAQIAPFEARFSGDRGFGQMRLLARLELDGNRDAYLREWTQLPVPESAAGRWIAEYQLAWLRQDFPKLDEMLARVGDSIHGDTIEPASLARAKVAWLEGRAEDARRLAAATLEAGATVQMMPRRQPEWRLYLAEAKALAGRHEEALREAADVMAGAEAVDAFAYRVGLPDRYGHILIICGRPEEALATLRAWMSGPGQGAAQVRWDPFWSRLKDDPRFEAVLAALAAKR